MTVNKREPKQLVRGKKFHKKLQEDWHKTASGEVKHEQGVVKPSGRKGRIDIFVNADDNEVAVVEIKDSDWDSMTLKALRRNVSRQASQIWDYIESQLEQSKDVSPGVIFSKRRPSIINSLISVKKHEIVPPQLPFFPTSISLTTN